jgi:hypothetical protein
VWYTSLILIRPFACPSELEQFQSNEFGGLLQTKDHHKDTSQVKIMLLVQSKLKHMTDEFVGEHHQPDTFDMSEVF